MDSLVRLVDEELVALRDEGYRAFQAKLIPTVDSERIVGVRTPDLRKLAKRLAAREDVETFLESLPHRLFEENQLHAFIVSATKDYDAAMRRLEAFLPFVDNWATCDQMSVKVLAKRPNETLAAASRWMASGDTYAVRFGIGVLMEFFLGNGFEKGQMDAVIGLDPGEYYVDMMRAWYMAEALVRQPDAALAVIEGGRLDVWTHNKSIQKAIESRRVPAELKERLRARRRSR